MKRLVDFKEDIHKCSKCGLCQAECPIYQITGNDCTVSRGHFSMLQGVINGELKLSKTINRYLDLCLKCGACSKFCPSGIDVVDAIIAAKSEYFKTQPFEKIKSLFQKYIVFGLFPRITRTFLRPTKSKIFEEKVLFFGGCGSKLKGDKSIVKILNLLNIEVVNPKFHCCGIPYFSRGDLQEFNNSIKSYLKILKKYNIKTVVTTCASCEKSLKDYIKWADDSDKPYLKEIEIKNIYQILKERNARFKLNKQAKVTYHKPCNISSFDDICWVLENIENLEYVQLKDYDKCCGLNGLTKINEYPILKHVINAKRQNIIDTGTNVVLTSCLGCEVALKSYSLGKYKTKDLIEFIANNI